MSNDAEGVVFFLLLVPIFSSTFVYLVYLFKKYFTFKKKKQKIIDNNFFLLHG